MAMVPDTTASRKWTILGAAIVFLGIAIRVYVFQVNHSLWLDEASLALNVLSRSFADLLKPLDYSQGAPIVFLWLEKLVTVLTRSSSELALRLVPLLSGSAACAAFWMLCRRFHLSPLGTVCATFLFSVSPFLIGYSVEAKQYSTDVLLAIALYLGAAHFLAKDSVRNSIVYAAIGLASIGLSYPAVFVMAGVGSVVLIDSWRKQDRRRLLLQGVIVCVWLMGFAVNYLFFLRHLGHIPGMIDYWQRMYEAFMPLSPDARVWLYRAGIRTASMTGFKSPIVLPLALIGAVVLWRRDWRIPVMLSIPAALAIFASALRQYPYAERMILFVTPSLLLFVGASFSARLPVLKWKLQPVAVAAFCAMLFIAIHREVVPPEGWQELRREEFRQAFLDVAGSGKCTDNVLVYERAANHYRYYYRYRWSGTRPAPIVTASQLTGGSFRFPDEHWIEFAKASDSDVSSFDNPPCFWLVFAHTTDAEIAQLSSALAARGYRQASSIRRTGASGYFYTLR